MAYRIEVSPNNRAGCKNKECKDAGVKIHKGELRFGTFITTDQFQSWAYKHWGCVTPKQIVNVKNSIDGEPNNLDGYEDLPEDLQEKISKALEDGHVADEDWRGDIEMNRTGKNGFRTPETKKARKEATKATEDGSPSPSKPPVKKRGRVKEDPDSEGAENDGPPAKKKKASVKKEKTKSEDADQPSKDETKPAKRGRKKATNVKAEVDPIVKHEGDEGEDGGAPASPPTKKGAASRKSAVAKQVKDEDVQSDGNDLQAIPEGSRSPPKKQKAPSKATANNDVKQRNTEANALPPVKKTRAPRKAKAKTAYNVESEETDDVEAEAQDVAAPVASKVSRASRNTKPRKNAVNEREPANDLVGEDAAYAGHEDRRTESDAEVEAQATAKPKKGRKKVAKKASKGKKSNVLNDEEGDP